MEGREISIDPLNGLRHENCNQPASPARLAQTRAGEAPEGHEGDRRVTYRQRPCGDILGSSR
jgi:hypothetical protein